jgi:proteasome subunit B (beta)-like protein
MHLLRWHLGQLHSESRVCGWVCGFYVHGSHLWLHTLATNGVVIATEKKLPTTLIDGDAFEKTQLITKHIGFVYSGMGPDYRVLVTKARKHAQVYYRTYLDEIPVLMLVKYVASVMQESTQSGYANRSLLLLVCFPRRLALFLGL